MEDVVPTQREILASLGSHPGCKKAHEVSLGCTDDMFVEKGEAINPLAPGCSVTFPPWGCKAEGFADWGSAGLLFFRSGEEGPVALG